VLQSYIAQNHKVRQILINEGDWQDPMHCATEMIQTDASQFGKDLAASVTGSSDTKWTDRWLAVADSARETIRNRVREIEEMFEGRVFSELEAILPTPATLFAGNSLPVRDLDSFFPTDAKQIRFLANRGTSGIDGVVSTALGVGAVSQGPTILVVGDVSFYHDMNGLLAAKQYRLNTTIVVINNNGGGIFSFLPQRDYPETFEKYFATPHGLTFQAAASLYGLNYTKVASWRDFHDALVSDKNQSRTSIVEVQTNRERNLEQHNQIWSAVEESTQEALMRRT
jgi:2-succinyl-5-enolpyruvyl-6-hydroxy-3-cyclohexene-1-carboxylate synthase